MRPEYINTMVGKHRNNGILMDTNILLLFLIGTTNERMITAFERTREFTVEDYYILTGLLNEFKKFVTTPNILTEVSNLSGKLKDKIKTEFMDTFNRWVIAHAEIYVESKSVDATLFKDLGITDAGIIELAKTATEKPLVLTRDLDLCWRLEQLKLPVLNFNHIRSKSY